MSQGLYMEDGSFMSFEREDLLTEIANRENALSFSPHWFGQLADPDPILRKMGEDSSILADLLADEQVLTAITSRKNRVLCADNYAFTLPSVDGAQPDTKAKLVFDTFSKDIERLKEALINSSRINQKGTLSSKHPSGREKRGFRLFFDAQNRLF